MYFCESRKCKSASLTETKKKASVKWESEESQWVKWEHWCCVQAELWYSLSDSKSWSFSNSLSLSLCALNDNFPLFSSVLLLPTHRASHRTEIKRLLHPSLCVFALFDMLSCCGRMKSLCLHSVSHKVKIHSCDQPKLCLSDRCGP